MTFPNVLGAESRKRWLHFVGPSAAGCWVVLLLGFSGYELHFSSAPVGFLFLIVVVSVAILSGFWQATVVSVTASLCLDFLFYPPSLSLNVNDPQDWISLAAFEISALVVSRVSSREQRSTRDAALQRMAMEHLYELSRSTLLINLHQAPGPQLTELIQRIFSLEAVSIFESNSGRTDSSGSWTEDERFVARECFFVNADQDDPLTQTSTRVLRVGANSVGAIAIRGQVTPLVMNALASLAAIALDRCVAFEKESRIEAAHQSERLRAAVLDSLAHAFKTPLTAIQAAGSGLREVGNLNDSQASLVALVEEESTQLNDLCTRLLQTAKLEADEFSLKKDEFKVADLVTNVLQDQSDRLAGHPVEVAVLDPGLTLRGDAELLSMALTQFLDNAAKYSFKGGKVKVSAWESHSEVMISVHNHGPAIPMADRERIFHRFYRSDASRDVAPGTGIGLSTVKMAAEAHKGHVWVISDAEEGTTFFLSLPREGRRSQT